MQRFARLALVGLLGGVAVAVPLTPAPAQPPIQIPPASPDGVEVLTRGPVHEAFASTAEMPTAGPVVTQLPPNPVEELPPDQKPEGDNVQWVPGYWHFDEDRTDFIWVSGFWRVPPPGRVWLPGSWREVPGGRQWVHGFWQEVVPAAAQQPQAFAQQLEYLPPPPQPLELTPSVPQPDATSFYVAGSWMWRGRYVWRPGYWVAHRPDWVWVPAHFRATPGGYLFIDGYWDYPLERRGVLFAPVYLTPVVLNRRAFVYTPAFAVSNQGLYGALFVRRGWSSYYFGDYFEPRYTTLGFNAWCGSPRGSGFAVSVGFGRGVAYDPLWNYYQVQHRSDPVFVANIHDTYAGRFRGDVPRPPRTLVQQTTVVNNITNVTNVTNVNNTTVNNTTINKTNAPVHNTVTNLTMVQPLKSVPQSNTNVVLKAVAKDEQVKEQQIARQTREVGVQRGRVETQLADRQLAPAQQTDKPRQVKLDVPQTVAARAQAPEAPRHTLPPKPTPQQAELNAKAPATIPPAKDGGKPEAPAKINAIPSTPPAPTPTTMIPAPAAKDPKNPRTPTERDPKTVVNPEPKTPVAPTPVTPAPVARDPKAPVMPAPTPVTPAPVVRDPKSPTMPAPVAPIPVPRPTPGNPEVKNPGRPVPAPMNPEVKPAPTPAVPPPQPPKLGAPPVPPPAPAKPVTLPPMTPVMPVNPPKSLPPPAPVAPAQLPPARPEVKVPPVNTPPARPDVKVPPVTVPPAPPAKQPPGKDPKEHDPKKPGQPNR